MRTVKRAIDPLGLFNPGKVSNFCYWAVSRIWYISSAIPWTDQIWRQNPRLNFQIYIFDFHQNWASRNLLSRELDLSGGCGC
jgi:hypothetical protein